MSKTIGGAFRDHHTAEQVAHELGEKGIPEKDISVVAREHGKTEASHPHGEEHDLSSGIGWGTAAGGTVGLLASAGALAIPGIGPILAAGPIVATLSGAAAGGLVGGLMDYGIPKQESEQYEKRLKEGDALVLVKAEGHEVDQAKEIFDHHGASDVYVH